MFSYINAFHFAQPAWLWGLLMIPLVWLYLRRHRNLRRENERLRVYADSHLLPHLLVRAATDSQRERRSLRRWSLLWLLGCLALAGPRWDFNDVEVFQPGSDLVILLDLSRSMEATDVKPSRLARARQEIDDLLELNPGIRTGLIAFATIAHVVSPITEDSQTLRHLLPSLSPALIQLQGSRLSEALERARVLFAGQPSGNSQAILLISDGDFAEPDLEAKVRQLRSAGITLYILGVGTEQGASLPAARGGVLQDQQGRPVLSRLEETKLRALAAAGQGLYVRADYRDDDSHALLARIRADAPPRLEENPIRIWQERYVWLVGLMMLIMLGWFRREGSWGWRT
jgi:Ca-activated chloride channel homolog